MTAELLVYQLDQHVFGYLRAQFDWQSDGSIRGFMQAAGLPGITYVGAQGGTTQPQDFKKVSCFIALYNTLVW